MFWHIYKNRFKCLIRSRMMVFWTLLYPIVIAMLFSLAFSNLNSNTAFATIPIAVVDNAQYKSDTAFQTALSSVSDTNEQAEQKLFHVNLTTKEQAEESLKNNEIKGYIYFDSSAHVIVKDSGIDQSILKQFMDSYLQMGSTIITVMKSNPEAVFQNAVQNYLHDVPPGRSQPDNTLIYYYALVGMACMFGGYWGRREISDIQANLSPQAARMNLIPVHKMKTFACSFCAAITVQFLCTMVLIAFLSLGLHVNFGDQLIFVVITCLAGSIAGVTFGAMVSSLVKGKEHLKSIIIVAVSMACSAMAGLFALSIKTSVMQSAPFLTYINPANLISDAFYSLYYYTTYTRYFISIGLLLAVSVVFFLIVYFVTRRQKYASL